MRKKIYLILLMVVFVFLTGCEKKEKFYLDTKYYNEGEFIKVDSDFVNNNKGSYVIFTYNNYCAFPVSCESVFKSFMEKYHIDFYSINIEEFKNTFLHDTVSYAPSVIIVKDGKVIDYLDAESDEDYKRYIDESSFEKWIKGYIYLELE